MRFDSISSFGPKMKKKGKPALGLSFPPLPRPSPPEHFHLYHVRDFSGKTFPGQFNHPRIDDEREEDDNVWGSTPISSFGPKKKKKENLCWHAQFFIRKSILHGKLYLSFGSRLTYNSYNSTGKRWWWWRREILPPCKYTFWTQFNWLMKKIIY